MKKICFLSGDITRSGGTERITSIISNGLLSNYKVYILSLCKDSDNAFFYFDDKIKIEYIFFEPSYNSNIKEYFYIIRNIRLFIKNNDIDVLIDVDTILDLFSIPALLLLKTKLISWEHFNFYENLGTRLRDYSRKIASKLSSAIVTITEEDKSFFLTNLHPKVPIYSIYNPIVFCDDKIKYNTKSRIILSAGRLTYQKGFDLLIEVADLVLKKHEDWTWIIVGDGEDKNRLENMIKQYDLIDRVILEGKVDNIEDYYRNSSIFVLTSRYEGFGLVLTEAKSYNLPCISFKCKAGPSEIIANNINGILIDCFDIKSMADSVNKLIENNELRIKFSENALYDTEKFKLNSIIEKWIDLIDKICV